MEAARDPVEETIDAGHLAMQELVLRLARRSGYRRSVELRPATPRRPTIDVALLDHARRILLICECWNRFADLGAAVRSTNRKIADGSAAAAAT